MSEMQIPNVLACDVGNTAVRIARVNGEQVEDVRRCLVGELSRLGEMLQEMWRQTPQPRRLAACSVNPAALRALEAAAAEAIPDVPVLVVGRDLPLPMPADLSDPAAVGTDRLCSAVAAYDRLGAACVVGDYGTAVTVDCVSDEGVFLGGAILPGIGMSLRALSAGTAQLPLVEPRQPDWVFGKDTTQAIIGGVVYGARGALRQLVEAYATALGRWPTVILTGSDAPLLCPEPAGDELVQAVVADLCLRGVAIAYYRTLL